VTEILIELYKANNRANKDHLNRLKVLPTEFPISSLQIVWFISRIKKWLLR